MCNVKQDIVARVKIGALKWLLGLYILSCLFLCVSPHNLVIQDLVETVRKNQMAKYGSAGRFRSRNVLKDKNIKSTKFKSLYEACNGCE